MRVGWKQSDEYWFASIGPCRLMLRPMRWSESRAREYREAVIEDRAWVFTVYHYPDRLDVRVDLIEGAFEVERRPGEGGTRQAQERVVALAQEIAICRRERQRREAPEAESIAWLENRLLETLRDSYKNWRERVARLRADAAAGDQSAAYLVSHPGNAYMAEPRWTTARLADEAAQYRLPDDLDAMSDKRFYQTVYNALERLRRRGLLTSSTGIDDRGREARLWEPA